MLRLRNPRTGFSGWASVVSGGGASCNELSKPLNYARKSLCNFASISSCSANLVIQSITPFPSSSTRLSNSRSKFVRVIHDDRNGGLALTVAP